MRRAKKRGERVMAISNLNETLLMYAKQKSMMTNKISDIQFNILAVSKTIVQKQAEFNRSLQALEDEFHPNGDYSVSFDEEQYQQLKAELMKDYEFSLQNTNSYEMELENQKESYDLRLQEITQNENSFKTLLKQNIKSDFTYGQVGGGS